MSDRISTLQSDTPKAYHGRMPYREEVTRHGGAPGVKYCFVHGSNMGDFLEQGWVRADADPVAPVHGPNGMCNSIVIMTMGRPIPGADPQNGVRQWYTDPAILAETGPLKGAEVWGGEKEEAAPEAPAETEAES